MEKTEANTKSLNEIVDEMVREKEFSVAMSARIPVDEERLIGALKDSLSNVGEIPGLSHLIIVSPGDLPDTYSIVKYQSKDYS